jgi:phosphatidylglycerol:prolipoprotein diacylglycerol transferase
MEKRALKKKSDKKNIENLLYIIFISSCIGGRIGYIIFYNFSYFSQNILCSLHIWEGGMSFHGGLIGAIIAMYYLSLKQNVKILKISDFIVPLVPFGLGAGRLGNFINSELFGRIAPNFPYAFLFPNTYKEDLKIVSKNPELQDILDKYGVLPRHPSQLYEFFLEGIFLFFIIYFFTRKKRNTGSISALFLISYGILRIISEFFREPDPQIGLLKNIITMGQILSIPMIIIGCIIICKSIYKK